MNDEVHGDLPRLLAETFHRECRQHLETMGAALATCRREPASRPAWQAIHQELDSLANAARAVNDLTSERLARRLATLARRARDEAPLRPPFFALAARADAAFRGDCLHEHVGGDALRAPLMAEVEALLARG